MPVRFGKTVVADRSAPGCPRRMTPALIALWLWIVFLVSWWTAALWTARAVSYGAAWQRITYFLGWALGFGLLFSIPPHLVGAGERMRFGLGGLLPASWQVPLWPAPVVTGWACVVLACAGFAFAWWARIHLGRLWSGMLTLREGHRVVDSGPYALVRHPIYTGFIVASWAFALILASGGPLLGALVLTVLMAIKAKGEERLLRRGLGHADYDAYAARVPMLVPFAPR